MFRRSRARCQPGLKTPGPGHRDPGRPLLERVEALQRLPQLWLPADDADQVVHRLLQLLVHRVGVLARRHPRARTAPARSATAASTSAPVTAGRSDPSPCTYSDAPSARPPAEDQQVGQRVAAQPVGPVHAPGGLAGGEQAGHPGRGAVGVDLDPTHHVVAGRADLHRLLGDVDIGEFLELVVHDGSFLMITSAGSRVDTSRKTPPCGDPRPALTSELIARATSSRGSSSGGRLLFSGSAYQRSPSSSRGRRTAAEHVGDVVEHEALALGVAQHSAVTADRLGDEDALHRRGPDHPGGVELDELHVDQRAAGTQRQRVAVAGVLPAVARHLVGLADTAGGDDHRGRLEEHELPGLAPVAEAHPRRPRRPTAGR